MFTQKIIKVQLTLQYGKFGNGTNSVIIDNLPIKVEVKRAGLPALDDAKVTILGLSRDLMESITFLNYRNLFINMNRIDIFAGDETGLDPVFSGEITSAIPNFNNAPSINMEIKAITGYSSNIKAVPPLSIKGNIPVSQLCEKIAKESGFDFRNKGVNVIASNPYLKGSNITKLKNIAQTYRIGMTIENKIVTIYPLNGSSAQLVLTISGDNGLIGYPSFTQNGIECKVMFAPAVSIGQKIQINSVIPKVSGTWWVYSLSHVLEANIPNGRWETDIQASYGEFYA